MADAKSDTTASRKCAWLRSQIIGKDTEFQTPFGKRLLTYADHTASGRALVHIEHFILQNVLPFYGNTHTDDSFVGSETSKMVHEAVSYIKRCLGGTNEDALLFCGSGSTAALKRLQEVMGIAIPSTLRSLVLKALPIDERWVVFTGPYEHHSNLLSWRQSLAEVVEIPSNRDGLIDMSRLRLALEDPQYSQRPKLGSFSACSNVTGLITDSRSIAQLLHEYGAFACFDFAASAPHVEIEMRSGDMEGYDALVISPHKFMGGPGTPGILLMSKNLYLLKNDPPSTCGGGTVNYVNGFNEKDTLYYEDVEEREDAGTPAIVQKIRCALCFWVKEYMGQALIDERESYFIEIAMRRLLKDPNVYILGNKKAKRGPILSFMVYTTEYSKEVLPHMQNRHVWQGLRRGKHLHARFTTKLLNDLFGIQSRGGCGCAAPYGHALLNIDEQQSISFRSAIEKGYNGLKPGWTRLSFCYYMSESEFDFILSSIEFVATYGQRFLPLYDFDWKTGDWTIKKNVGRAHPCLFSSRFLPTHGEEAKLRSIDSTPPHVCLQHKYESYLQSAKTVAKSLDRFPEQRAIPDDIHPETLLFRV